MATSFGSVIANMFGGNQQAQQAQNQPGTPGNIPANNANPAHPNNVNAPAATIAAIETPVSPLEKHTEMWDPTKMPVAPKQEPIFNVDPKAVQAAASKNNFMSVVTPEQMTAIKAGGDGAAEVMLQVMQSMNQKGFGDSATATASLITEALEKQEKMFMAKLPSIIGKQNLNDTLSKQNPIFDHPAAGPMLDILKQQVAGKYPGMSVDEQAAKAQEYLVDFANAANPKKPVVDKNEMDWDLFLGDQ